MNEQCTATKHKRYSGDMWAHSQSTDTNANAIQAISILSSPPGQFINKNKNILFENRPKPKVSFLTNDSFCMVSDKTSNSLRIQYFLLSIFYFLLFSTEFTFSQNKQKTGIQPHFWKRKETAIKIEPHITITVSHQLCVMDEQDRTTRSWI